VAVTFYCHGRAGIRRVIRDRLIQSAVLSITKIIDHKPRILIANHHAIPSKLRLEYWIKSVFKVAWNENINEWIAGAVVAHKIAVKPAITSNNFMGFSKMLKYNVTIHFVYFATTNPAAMKGICVFVDL
jgi:hypothetical protein